MRLYEEEFDVEIPKGNLDILECLSLAALERQGNGETPVRRRRRCSRVTAGGDQQKKDGCRQPANQTTSRGSSMTVPSVISKMRTTGLSMSISDTNT